MNILFVAHDASMYGSNQSLFFLIIELRKRYKVKPFVLVPNEGGFTQKLKEEHIDYTIVNYSLWQAVYKTGFRFIVKAFLRRTKNLFARRKVRKAIVGREIDIVHSNSSVVEVGAECANILKKPHIWHIREFGLDDWGMHYMYSRKFVRRKYNEAAALITVSKSLEKKFRNEFPEAVVRTIYNGISSEKFGLRKRVANEQINFCQVGYISSGKNQMQVLEACKQLRDIYHLNFKMNFIGSGDSDYYQSFLHYIKDNDLSSYIDLWGFQEHVEAILPQMDVGIVSSRMEGFGRVTVEFMMSGIPVIGYASGGTQELIEDGKTGFLYHSLDDLVRCMVCFAQKKNKIDAMGLNAYAKARSEYTVGKNADLIYEVYRDVLNKT